MSDKYDLFYVSKSNKYSSSMDNTQMTAHAYNLKQLGFIVGNTKEFYNNEFHNLNTFNINFGIPNNRTYYDYGSNSTDSIIYLYIKQKGNPKIIGQCCMILRYYFKMGKGFSRESGLETIYIDSMDVSEEGFKNLGSLFIKKIKEFSRMSYCPEGVINICLTAHPTEHSFYTKLGFKIKPGLGDIIFDKILLLSRMFLEQTGFKITNLEESKDPSKRLEEMVYIVDMKLNDKTRTQSKTIKRTQSKTSKRTNRTMSKSIKI